MSSQDAKQSRQRGLKSVLEKKVVKVKVEAEVAVLPKIHREKGLGGLGVKPRMPRGKANS